MALSLLRPQSRSPLSISQSHLFELLEAGTALSYPVAQLGCQFFWQPIIHQELHFFRWHVGMETTLRHKSSVCLQQKTPALAGGEEFLFLKTKPNQPLIARSG